MKTIALTPRLDLLADYGEVRESVDQQWGCWLSRLGYRPLILSHSTPLSFLEELKIDGLLLTGGNDLSAVSDCPLAAQRDSFEKQLLQKVMAKGLPVLGVCRGMQLIADYFGGELEPIGGHVATSHKLELVADSRYYSELCQQSQVNSFHNYSVSRTVPELKVAAYSADDRAIEAIEHVSYPMFGQMWHPERNQPANPADGLILQRLFG